MDLTSLRVPRARAARSCRREDLSDEDFGPVLAHLVRWVAKEIPVGRTLEESPASREQSWLASVDQLGGFCFLGSRPVAVGKVQKSGVKREEKLPT